MPHERQLDDLRRDPLAAHVDLQLHAGLRLGLGDVRGADRLVHRRRDGAAAHDVHFLPVHVHVHAVAAHDLGLQDREPDEPSRHALELLLLQGRLAGERRPLVELHDERQPRLIGCDRVVDVVAVQGQPGLEPQRVAGAEAARLSAPRAGERMPQLLRVRGAAVDLEAVLAGVAGARNEHFRPRHLTLREMVVGDHRHAERRQRREQRFGLGTLDREQRHVVRDVLEPDVGAAFAFHDVRPIRGAVGGVDDQHQAVVEAVHEAVVHERAALGEDRRVLRLARLQRADVVAGDALHEGVAVGPRDLELAHVRDVEDAHGLAHRPVLGADAGGIRDRHLEARVRHHLRAQGDVHGVQRRLLESLRRHVVSPSRVASSAFWTWRRFSASSNTRDCGPSITASVTSSPRCAGRQCRKIALGSATFISSGSTV